MPPEHRSRMARWRAASLIGVHVLFGLHYAHWKIAGRTLAPVEPSEMFHTLHLGIITVGFLFMAGLVVATSVAGRFFCGWGCHLLALQDLCAWILRKFGIRAKPIRSRTLLWVPLLTAIYLFVWPQVLRLLQGKMMAPLHVVTDSDGWTSFTTTDLLRSFPGLGMTLFTFAICGFAIVYFLGSRSFCSYACPYGAMFSGAERLAPLRIIAGSGECSQCGLCTASCRSNIRVIEEVRQFGTVMSSNCMKDLDCVSVCPTDALKFGLTKPPLFRSWRMPRSLKKKYDFSLGEDFLMAGVFAATLPVVRGLYDAISFLLALAISALLAYFAVLSVRLVRHQRVQLSNLQLKVADQLTTKGRVFAVLASLLGLFMLHSTFIRYHAYAGQRAFAEIQAIEESAAEAIDGSNADDALDTETPTLQARSTALYHLEQAYRWGLFRSTRLRRELAALYQQEGSLNKAYTQLCVLLAQDPSNQKNRIQLGQLYLKANDLDRAKQQFQQVLASMGDSLDSVNESHRDQLLQGTVCFFLGDAEARGGNHSAAMQQFELAVRYNPKNAQAYLALGAMQAAAGHLEQASISFKASAQLRPDSAAAHNNLGAILVRLKQEAEALHHYRQSLALMPDNPLAHYNVGLLLTNQGKLDEAEETFKRALALQPKYAAAHVGLALICQRRGQPEQAAWHRKQAAELRNRP